MKNHPTDQIRATSHDLKTQKKVAFLVSGNGSPAVSGKFQVGEISFHLARSKVMSFLNMPCQLQKQILQELALVMGI